jgi:hypothetical protein
MVYFFHRLYARGHPVAQRRMHSPWPRPFPVLKTVDRFERLIADPRGSTQARKRKWSVSLLASLGLAVFFVVVVGVLGLAWFVGIGPLP